MLSPARLLSLNYILTRICHECSCIDNSFSKLHLSSSRCEPAQSRRQDDTIRRVHRQSLSVSAEYAAVNATCRDTHEPVETLFRCNGEREPS